MNTNVIKVDFRTKTVVDNRKQITYQCHICRQNFYYDSKYHKRVPLLVKIRKEVYCPDCIDSMAEFLKDERKRIFKEDHPVD